MDNIQVVHVDANALAHASKARVYGEGMDGTRNAENLELHASGVVVDLIRIISKFKPKKAIFIAWDGTPVGAKIKQQRERRVNHAKISDAAIDPNIITTGTLYMHELEARIAAIIQEPQYAAVFPPEVIIDPSSNPGEGEHKIADFIRSWRDREWKADEQKEATGAHVIEGADGDFALLVLMMGLENVWLHRSAESGKYGCLESSTSYSHLLKVAQEMTAETEPKLVAAKLVAMWTVLGNDFMPALPGLIVWKSAVDRLATYMDGLDLVYLDAKSGLYRLNYDGFIDYLLEIDGELQDFIDDNVNRKKKQSNRLLHPLMQKSTNADRFRRSWPSVFAPAAYEGFDSSSVRDKWLLEGDDLIEARMTKASRDYAVTADWMLVYYQVGVKGVDQYWYYPYQYAPMAGYIAEHIFTGPYEDTEAGRFYEDPSIEYNEQGYIIGRDVTAGASHIDGAFTGLHQLLISLPPTSKDLLPSGAQAWMESDTLVGDIYPRYIRTHPSSNDGGSHLDVKEINMPSMRRVNEYVAYMNRVPKDIDSTRFDRQEPFTIENELAYTSNEKIEQVKVPLRRVVLDTSQAVMDEAEAFMRETYTRRGSRGRGSGAKNPRSRAKTTAKPAADTAVASRQVHNSAPRVRGAEKTTYGRGRGGRGGSRGSVPSHRGVYAGSALV